MVATRRKWLIIDNSGRREPKNVYALEPTGTIRTGTDAEFEYADTLLKERMPWQEQSRNL
jgi:hypothetical protein